MKNCITVCELLETAWIDEQINGVENGVNGDVCGDDNIAMVLQVLAEKPKIKQPKLAVKIGVSARTISRIISNLRDSDVIRRVGSDKSGHWEVIGKSE